VFKSKKNADRDLGVPSEVVSDAKAKEVLRAWVANEGLVCALMPETWPDVVARGIVLADVTRHVANGQRSQRRNLSTEVPKEIAAYPAPEAPLK
jgi:Domain of unknown function (DUF5076)